MKVTVFIVIAFTLAGLAQADFSYKVTRKTGGTMASMAGAGTGPQVSTNYFKGQKMKVDNGATASILDFDAQTITTVNNTDKTYTVKSFGDLTAAANTSGIETKIDVKETGQKKMVNGFNASELIMTLEVEASQGSPMGKMQMELDIWASPDVPGGEQMHDFYRRNAGKFPWAAMAKGANPGMQKAIADMQQKMTAIDGVPVEEIMRMKPAGGAGAPAMPQISGAQSAQLAQARSKLEAMVAQGGPGAAYAKQALDKMPGGAPSGGAGASSGAMIEITSDSSDFSSSPVPDSVFAIPAGYQKGN